MAGSSLQLSWGIERQYGARLGNEEEEEEEKAGVFSLSFYCHFHLPLKVPTILGNISQTETRILFHVCCGDPISRFPSHPSLKLPLTIPSLGAALLHLFPQIFKNTTQLDNFRFLDTADHISLSASSHQQEIDLRYFRNIQVPSLSLSPSHSPLTFSQPSSHPAWRHTYSCGSLPPS